MFRSSCAINRESVYGVRCSTEVKPKGTSFSTGSGFTIAPGMVITAGHLVHMVNNANGPVHKAFDVIRSPDIGQQLERARLIAEDPMNDIALLMIDAPRSNKFLTLEPNKVQTGSSCGSLGFPLCGMVQDPSDPKRSAFSLVERFQGSHISSFQKYKSPKGFVVDHYEVDSLMYEGSSGCPGFLTDTKVVGMQSQSLMDAKTTKKGNANRIAISIWVPSTVIIEFARKNGILV